jgi:TPR repeat protein
MPEYNVGWCYEEGIGVPQDIEKTIDWYKKALEDGYEEASEALARLS